MDASTEMLREVHRHSHLAGLDQLLTADVLGKLDPEGYHVLVMSAAFFDRARHPDVPRHRVLALLKLEGRPAAEPVHRVFDVVAGDWDCLVRPSDVTGDPGDDRT